MKRQIRYYESYTDDFEKTKNQDFALPDDYKWVRTDLISRIMSGVIYTLAYVFSWVYCRLVLHMCIKGRRNLRGMKEAFFIFGNHTQPVGDVFIPAHCVFPRRIYTVVSPANYGMPFIGKILPYLGALPIADSIQGMRELQKAMDIRLSQGHPIVIYPEAHVWDYCTQIRPFPVTSFRFPVKMNRPSYAMTVTYRKSSIFKRPIMNVYIDGPYHGEGETSGERAKSLHALISAVMEQRSCESDFSYIEYRNNDKQDENR